MPRVFIESVIDDRFMLPHGLPDVPDAFWKVVIRNDRVIAWWIPNSPEATKNRLDEYIVSAASIQDKAKVKLLHYSNR